jgi:hypothetical protein
MQRRPLKGLSKTLSKESQKDGRKNGKKGRKKHGEKDRKKALPDASNHFWKFSSRAAVAQF